MLPVGFRRNGPRAAVERPSADDLLVLSPARTREWRNWQTRRIQVPVPARAWGFKSPLAHGRSARSRRFAAAHIAVIESRDRDLLLLSADTESGISFSDGRAGARC